MVNIMRRLPDKIFLVTTSSTTVLLLVCTVLPFVALNSTESPIVWVQDDAWSYLGVMAFVLAVIMPLAMLVLYSYQIEKTGLLGLIGLGMSLIGFLGYLCLQFDMAFVWPVLAERAPDLVDFNGPMFSDRRFAFVHFWMGPVHTVGMLLFGIALVRARVLPRVACIFFIIGLIMSPGALFPPFLIRAVGGVIGALGLGWMTLVLWQRTGRDPVAT
jgi:hypothetical protein